MDKSHAHIFGFAFSVDDIESYRKLVECIVTVSLDDPDHLNTVNYSPCFYDVIIADSYAIEILQNQDMELTSLLYQIIERLKHTDFAPCVNINEFESSCSVGDALFNNQNLLHKIEQNIFDIQTYYLWKNWSANLLLERLNGQELADHLDYFFPKVELFPSVEDQIKRLAHNDERLRLFKDQLKELSRAYLAWNNSGPFPNEHLHLDWSPESESRKKELRGQLTFTNDCGESFLFDFHSKKNIGRQPYRLYFRLGPTTIQIGFFGEKIGKN